MREALKGFDFTGARCFAGSWRIASTWGGRQRAKFNRIGGRGVKLYPIQADKLGAIMRLNNLRTTLERRDADTPDTLCSQGEVSAKPVSILACTLDTPDTNKMKMAKAMKLHLAGLLHYPTSDPVQVFCLPEPIHAEVLAMYPDVSVANQRSTNWPTMNGARTGPTAMAEPKIPTCQGEKPSDSLTYTEAIGK